MHYILTLIPKENVTVGTVDLINLCYLFVYLFSGERNLLAGSWEEEGAQNQWEARESDQVASNPGKGMWLKHHLQP